MAAHLWRLLVVDADLPSHLRALKDYCLLGRGDLWHGLLGEAAELMAVPAVTATARADLESCLQVILAPGCQLPVFSELLSMW